MSTNRLLNFFSSFLATSLVGLSCAKGADILSEIAAGQQAQVKKGSQVTVTEDIKGKPWPKVSVYALVDATPEEVAAVFFDFDNAKSYVPNVLKSEISNRISPCVVEIDYGLDVPILPDEYYTTRNSLKKLTDQGFQIDWKLIRAVQTKDSEGSFRVMPYEGKSLICYQNLVTPGTGMAGILRGKAVQQMKETVDALITQVEKQKKSNPADLKKQVSALQAALKAEK